MANLPPVYEILARSDNPAADDALAEALPRLRDPYLTHAVTVLLQRGNSAGVSRLLARYESLPVSLRGLVIAAAGRLAPALRVAVHAVEVDARVAALHVVRESTQVGLADIAAGGLHDAAPRVREAAALALLSLADRYTRQNSETIAALHDSGPSEPRTLAGVTGALHLLAEERRVMEAALQNALGCFSDHRRTEIVEAAAILALEFPAAMLDPGSSRRAAFMPALKEILESSNDPRLAGFVCQALTRPDLRTAALRRIENGRDASFFANLLRCRWLLADAAIAKALGQVRRLAWISVSPDPVFELPEELQTAFPAWLMAMGLPTDFKVDTLIALLGRESSDLARAAVFALARIDGQSATRALERASKMPDPRGQKIAAAALAQRARVGRQTSRHLVGRQYASRDEQRRDTFAYIWENFDHLQPVVARALGRRFGRDIGKLAIEVRGLLLGPSAETRCRALKMIVALGVSKAFVGESASLATDEDSYVRATAMLALGQAGGPTSRRILERALSDSDTRVVANAVEGMDRLGTDARVEVLGPLLEHGDNRVRANAVRALVRRRVPQAARALVSMLGDPRRAHRESALWLIDRLQLIMMLRRVQELAATDTDSGVRQRAAEVAKRLMQRATARKMGAQSAAAQGARS